MFPLWNVGSRDLHRFVQQQFEDLIYRPWDIPLPGAWQPPLDIRETPDAYVVEVDLPGVPPEDIAVRVSSSQLSIRGERRETMLATATPIRRERWVGVFERTVLFPVPVEPQKVRADFREGICSIRLPRRKGPPDVTGKAIAEREYEVRVTFRVEQAGPS